MKKNDLRRVAAQGGAVLLLHHRADKVADVAQVLQAFEFFNAEGGMFHACTSATGRRPANERT